MSKTDVSSRICVLLAGGESKRMGSPKALLPYCGRPWIISQVQALCDAGIDNVVVVTGAHRAAIADVLPQNKNVHCVENSAWESGTFSSVQVGLKFALERFAKASEFFLTPIDVPCSDRDVFDTLLQTRLQKEEVAAVVPVCADRGGHPVLLCRTFAESLLKVKVTREDARLDRQLAAAGDSCVRVPVTDTKVILNLNTPEQWQEFCRRL